MFFDLTDVSEKIKDIDHDIIKKIMHSINYHKPFPDVGSTIDHIVINKDRNAVIIVGDIYIRIEFSHSDVVSLEHKNLLLQLYKDFVAVCPSVFPIGLADSMYCGLVATDLISDKKCSVKFRNFHDSHIDMTQAALNGDQVGLLNAERAIGAMSLIAKSLPAVYMPYYNFSYRKYFMRRIFHGRFGKEKRIILNV